MKISSDTITAISTAPGPGALSVIRLSGPDTQNIVKKIFSGKKNFFSKNFSSEISSLKANFAQHGYIYDPSTKDIIDEVILVFFKEPHTYTGEDVVEISCHGGPIISSEIISLLISQGARLAQRGEFSQRAFLNGKIDLTQAEAILDIIQAKTSRQSRNAVSVLTGRLGEQIKSIRKELIFLLTRIVAGIDFPEEIGDAPEPEIESIVKKSLDSLSLLSKTARSGKFLREGLKLAIVGRPNVGKSSLLNQFLKYERAIVTDIPGTTRDSLEELMDLNGIPVTLIDTAGIRDTNDQVEQLGIKRSHQSIKEADLILFIVDISQEWTEAENNILEQIGDAPWILVKNKIDILTNNLVHQNELEEPRKTNFSQGHPLISCALAEISVSAKNGYNIDILNKTIEDWIYKDNILNKDTTLNLRQSALCQKVCHCLSDTLDTIQNKMPQDCLASDIKIACDILSEISGESVSEEIITEVFAQFCIGK